MKGLLSAYLFALEKSEDGSAAGAKNAREWLPQLIKVWNDVLSESGFADFAIGPRFFLDKNIYLDSNKVVDQIILTWDDSVYPFLRHVLKPMGRQEERAVFEDMMSRPRGTGSMSGSLPEKMKTAMEFDKTGAMKLRLPPKVATHSQFF